MGLFSKDDWSKEKAKFEEMSRKASQSPRFLKKCGNATCGYSCEVGPLPNYGKCPQCGYPTSCTQIN